MIAKIDDSNITADTVDTMSDADYKAFENRLRREAARQGLNVSKYVGPRFLAGGVLAGMPDDVFMLTDKTGTIRGHGMDIIALRDELYGGES